MKRFGLSKQNIFNCIIIILIFLWYHDIYINNAIHFYRSYPNEYMWGELFISYAGGLLRRGFTGSILFFLAKHGVNIQLLVPIFIYILTVLFTFYCMKEIYKNIDSEISVFIILSPGCLLFLFYDFRVFARRDIVVLYIFILLMYIIYTFKIRSIYKVVYCIIIFGVLIHESLIFYLPAPFFLLYEKWKKEKLNIKLFFIYCFSLFLPIIFFILFFNGCIEQRNAIETQWKSIIPNYEIGRYSGLTWIGAGIKSQLPFLYFPNAKIWMINVFLGYLLTFAPIFFLIWKYKLVRNLLNIYKSTLERSFLVLSVFSPFFMVILTLDSGRFISMHSITLVFFLIYVSKFDKLEINGCNDKQLLYTVPLLLIYSLLWRMIHFDSNGRILLWSDMKGGFFFLM